MKRYKLFLMLLLTLMASGLAQGQAVEQAKPAEVDQSQLDSLRTEGSAALFSLDYEGARQKFLEIRRLFPSHPAGPLLLASSMWLQKLNESRRLQAALYNSKTFYAKTEDKIDLRAFEPFKELVRQAIALSKARLKTTPRDTEALYYLGAAEGLKAAFEGTVERSFMSALRDGSSSVEHHRQVLKLDPAFRDAELTIGLYDYVVGSLPLPVKLLASVAGVRGSKKRGLATLERVAKEGRWSKENAKIILIALYKREKRFADALALVRDLSAQYPRNYLLKLETADALISQAAVERQAHNSSEPNVSEREALSLFESLLRDRDNARSHDLIRFRYAEALLLVGQPETAAREFLSAAAAPGAEASLATMAHLRAAQSLDLSGKRKEAVTEYQAVLNRPNVYDMHEEARRGLREPYKQ
ncbi:MAG TPA: hypothetical protein VGB17_16200 [Pyrinomonadaceae bacterium]|jgi:tetratricopeptide (TPR) repeat protein